MMRSILTVMLTIGLLAATGCGRGSSPGSANSDGAHATDDPANARIVALSPAVATILRDIGLEERIVGRSSWDFQTPASVPVVGDQAGIDYEMLLEINPTHVIMQWGDRDLPPRLESLADEFGWAIVDYPLLSLDDIATTTDDLYLRFIGFDEPDPTNRDPAHRFDKVLPSERLAKAWRDRGKDADAAGRVLPIMGISPPGVPGPGSFHHELIVRLGATPMIKEGNAWIELDAEDILRLAPDSIVVFAIADEPAVITGVTAGSGDEFDPKVPTREGYDERLAALGRIAGLPIPAVEHGRIGFIEGPFVAEPSTGFAWTGEALGALFEAWAEPTYTPSP